MSEIHKKHLARSNSRPIKAACQFDFLLSFFSSFSFFFLGGSQGNRWQIRVSDYIRGADFLTELKKKNGKGRKQKLVLAI